MKLDRLDTAHPAFRQAEADTGDRVRRLLAVNGRKSVDALHRELGRGMWGRCGMSRHGGRLTPALEQICGLPGEVLRGRYVGRFGEHTAELPSPASFGS